MDSLLVADSNDDFVHLHSISRECIWILTVVWGAGV
jgi:hypothetical protein